MISLPPDEASRDCPVLTEFEDHITRARAQCATSLGEAETEYYYEYEDGDTEEEQYEEYGDSYEQRGQYGSFQPVFSDSPEYEDPRAEVVEYDYEFTDNCTTYYDGAWASVAGWGATYKFDGSCILRHARKKEVLLSSGYSIATPH